MHEKTERDIKSNRESRLAFHTEVADLKAWSVGDKVLVDSPEIGCGKLLLVVDDPRNKSGVRLVATPVPVVTQDNKKRKNKYLVQQRHIKKLYKDQF